MKKKKNVVEQAPARRLELRKQILRNLGITELTAVVGGCDPQCMMTRGEQ